ncbi:MAG: hypothetical protein ABJG41_03900 [Cyclobacteriaceae bacterium]|uniref:hypothetical protein n=1 Tax=Ekhidna sp. TaxID=2608089 RepID=UPI003292B10E
MKKIIFILLLFLVITEGFGQERTFFGKYVDLYEGTFLVVSPDYIEYLTRPSNRVNKFFRIDTLVTGKRKNITKTPVYNPIEATEVVQDTFRVVDIFTETNTISESDYWVFVLQNRNTNSLYKLHYNEYAFYDFPFYILNEITIPDKYFCSEIYTSTDKFTDILKETTSANDDITFLTYRNKNDTAVSYYVTLSIYTGAASMTTLSNATLLLNNGKKLTFSDIEIDLSVSNPSSSFITYSAFAMISLTKDHLQNLISSPIVAFRLGIEDNDIPKFESIRFHELAKCIFNKHLD